MILLPLHSASLIIIPVLSRREGVGVVYHKHAFITDMHILSSAVGVLYM